jgi:5'-methylthioadenosine phosphorylase
MPRLAIIGGTGFYKMSSAPLKEKREVDTKYGHVTVYVYTSQCGQEFVFLPRHGEGHARSPSHVNYRANIMALKQLGVDRIIAVCSVGSLRKEIKPGDFVLVDQFLDFTKSRPSTFYDEDGTVVHTDVTNPYCSEIGDCIKCSPANGITLHGKGTYVCTEGPRFETAAEIRMFAMLGGDVVGMTAVPECVLARELGICYACIAVVTNFAAGIGDRPLTHGEVIEEMSRMQDVLNKYVVDCLSGIPEKRSCTCSTDFSRL